MPSYTYPEAPNQIPANVVTVSAQFRKEVNKIILALAGFSLLYLILLALSLTIAAGAIFFGIGLIALGGGFMPIVIGASLAFSGLMIGFFSIKFLFAGSKKDRSELVEISETEYPELFSFIRQISEETNVQFPKHIYLSPEVNAYVFYDSNFWSMFFPVRKNLVIGLGLVNMINMGEFKSVIAHEFGHFSQKSMRAGSFVYQANKIVHNLVNENEDFTAVLNRWAKMYYVFALFAIAINAVVKANQWLLRKGYVLINKQYMKLSREMEFHADAVSASVAGSNNAIHALRRIEFADSGFENVIGQYNSWVADNLKGNNVYTQTHVAVAVLSKQIGFPIEHGLPVFTEAGTFYINYNRISVDNQWSSHPTREQREEALKALNVDSAVVTDSPWLLFPDAAALQERTTQFLYRNVEFTGEPEILDDDKFGDRYSSERTRYQHAPFYMGYYDGRRVSKFQLDSTAVGCIDDIESFLRTHADLHRRVQAAKQDIQFLEQLGKEPDGIRFFDFNGTRYKVSQTGEVKAQLEEEVSELETEIIRCDEAIYRYSYFAAGPGTDEALYLKSAYRGWNSIAELIDDRMLACDRIVEKMQALYTEQTLKDAQNSSQNLVNACRAFENLHVETESVLRANVLTPDAVLPALLYNHAFRYSSFLNEHNQFDFELVDGLLAEVNQFAEWIAEMGFVAQKNLLNAQLTIIQSSQTQQSAVA